MVESMYTCELAVALGAESTEYIGELAVALGAEPTEYIGELAVAQRTELLTKSPVMVMQRVSNQIPRQALFSFSY